MKPQSIGIQSPILLPKTNSIKSATSANQQRCICFAAERYRANTRARKLAVTKSKRPMSLHILKRKVFPESYSAPAGWYKGNYTVKMSAEVPEQTLENMKLYYTELFAQYPDVLTATDISKVIDYGTTSINDWCRKGYLKAFKRNNMNHIPKVYLIEFCCSKYFRTITRKSDWHIRVLQEFPRWQVIRGLKTKE